ncbi:MAG TPA: alpha-1,4-glucan--maltose-1-phosphate maltosyltransferase [Gemmatimonadaceae bacterium]|nr:alpha-1,4-glucan--maltose-1-phosphate maltosyltransferase [Gemmatimonadaceae bacterium]
MIECVSPDVQGGRYPAKRIVGDVLEVGADIFKDGHDLLAARVRYESPDGGCRSTPMAHDQDTDRWTGTILLDRVGRWSFVVDAWTDRFGTWRAGLEKKIAAGVDVSVELLEGALLVEGAGRRARDAAERVALRAAALTLRDETASLTERQTVATSDALRRSVDANYAPDDLTTFAYPLEVVVDRPLAGFASWYELFPRSQSPVPGRHGTFADTAAALPRVAKLGFDVVYFPPIHPIGRTARKGKNNTLTPTADDVGSPWAIGNEHGGHDAIEPALGTIEDFDRLVAAAEELGLEIALDYALQCSPDHPWVKEHPDWFHIRPDGSIQYAENPPKKYQDIYPLNFWCRDRENLWNACRDVLLHWVSHGVRIFRVDNPHTKPSAFWEWVIREVQAVNPDVIFFAEAFTRPKKLKSLAKLGFTQSYTYFTWKNTKDEIVQFMQELLAASEYLRGNLFANTPDILHEYLVHGGRNAFRVRLLLATTLQPLYGIYSGYELSENVPVKPGSEEYMNSEKYEIRQRNFAAPGNLDEEIRRLNSVRRCHAALQRATNLTFHPTDNPNIIFYRRAGAPSTVAEAGTTTRGETILTNDILVVVNLDPQRPHHTTVEVPIAEMGIGPDDAYTVEDLLTGTRYTWRGARNYVRLDPAQQPGHILRVHR